MFNLQCILNKNSDFDFSYSFEANRKPVFKKDEDILLSLNEYLNISNNHINKTNAINNSKDSFYLEIIGGESGLWSEKLCDGILNSINKYSNLKSLGIFTNGLLFKQPWAHKFKNHTIFYHHLITNKPEKLQKIEGYKIVYIAIITEENIKYIEGFLSLNQDKKIIVRPAHSNNLIPEKSLSIEKYKELVDRIKNYSNVDKDSFLTILSLKNKHLNNTLQDSFEPCRKQTFSKIIDICEETILPCCKSITKIPLNNDNFINYLNNIYIETDCSGCKIPISYYQTTKEK